MKLKKFLPIILLALVLLYAFLPDAGGDSTIGVIQGSDSAVSTVISNVAETIEDERDVAPEDETEAFLDPDGYYYSKDEVALYIYTYGFCFCAGSS